MFAADCFRVGGKHVAVCMKGFYYGSCCGIGADAIEDNVSASNDIDSSPLRDFSLWNRLPLASGAQSITSINTFFQPPKDPTVRSPLEGLISVSSPSSAGLINNNAVNATGITEQERYESPILENVSTNTAERKPSSTVVMSPTTIKTPISDATSLSSYLPSPDENHSLSDSGLGKNNLSFADPFPDGLIVAISDSAAVNQVNQQKGEICGTPVYRWPRIVSGENARPGQWPWMISVQVRTRRGYYHKCGAALLNKEWALTAAHCLASVQQDSILVKYGGLDFASIEDKFYESKVLSFPHPKFSMKTQKFDIALLKLLTPVEYQFNVLPICLPDKDMIFDEEQSIVAGWGKLAEKGLVTTKLQYVGIPIINNTECQTIYKRINKLIDQDLMCAGYDIGQKDSCEGDSGGPMMVFKRGRWVAAGVISWGVGCARPNQPGVSTRVTEFLDWIYSHVSPKSR